MLPFLVSCFYWHPVGTHAVDWISNWGGKYDTVSWWEQQLDWYTTTMGRYSSTALLSTVGNWYRLSTARIVVLVLHLALGGALFFLASTLLQNWKTGLVVTLTVLALYLSQLSNPYDSLYRLTGLFIYQTGLISSLVLAGLLWRGHIFLALPVIVFTVGTNEISLLHTGLLIGSYILLRPECLRTPAGWSLIVTAALSAAVALLAPGNWVRADLYHSAAFSDLTLVGVVIASGVYLMVSWISSTSLLPILLLCGALLPRISFTRRQRQFTILMSLVLPVLSVAPVLVATRGESLPEGITDWQIIPTVMLLIMVVTSLPRLILPGKAIVTLAVFIGLANLLGGLYIDRGREGPPRGPIDRIVIASPPGAAWLQLLTGKTQRYDQSVERQYAVAQECEAGDCVVPPMAESETYLYDASYDRRVLPYGDPWFGYLVNRPDIVVFAKQPAVERR
ncbi:hypothetical protein [Neolewinella xylanilytica]|nr:hypothetical protein [Neolewinella xylanilytica]